MHEDQGRVSEKKLKIDKANTTMLATLAIATFVVVFSLVSIKDLLSQYEYQKRVSSAQQTTINDLKQDQLNATQLVSSYSSFISQTPNILGGSSSQENNAQIILDALPTDEDVPAALAGVSNIFSGQQLSISGLSSSVVGAVAPASSSSSAVGVIPFSFSTAGSTQTTETLLNSLELSIRPMQVDTLTLSGTDSSLQVNVTGETYFQPPTRVSVSSELVK